MVRTRQTSAIPEHEHNAETKNDSGYVDNWQTGKTVTECNLHMLTTEDCSDVIFRVGSEKHVVRAHRYVLVSRSCVFHAMFCGPLAEKGEVTIPDIDLHIFRHFLRFVYTDSVDITTKNVIGLTYSARKYDCDSLLKQCEDFLEKSLSDLNVCFILEQCHSYGDLKSEEMALNVLRRAGLQVVMPSHGFKFLCQSCFETFLKSDELDIQERFVFDGVKDWLEHQCEQQNLDHTPENMKNLLGDLRYEIRFSYMTAEDLVKIVGPTGILTNDERLCIIDNIISGDVDVSPFKTSSRKGTVFYARRLYRSLISNDLEDADTGEKESITFTVNKPTTLFGFCVYGHPFRSEQDMLEEENEDFEYELAFLKVKVSLALCVRADCLLHFTSDHVPLTDIANKIWFPNGITLKPYKQYKLKVCIEEGKCSRGTVTDKIIVTERVVFNVLTSTNGREIGIIQSLMFR